MVVFTAVTLVTTTPVTDDADTGTPHATSVANTARCTAACAVPLNIHGAASDTVSDADT